MTYQEVHTDSDWQRRLNDLNITEATLNELLANVTISTMSRGFWYRSAHVNTSEMRNMYQFSRPINLVLPYSLCLTIGFVVVGLGFRAMRENEVAVADSGFLQVMMATRGNTKLEALVERHGLVSPNSILDELKDLEVRYGELMVDGEGGKYGFGTAEETAQLRRK
jgi:hypothetical protein